MINSLVEMGVAPSARWRETDAARHPGGAAGGSRGGDRFGSDLPCRTLTILEGLCNVAFHFVQAPRAPPLNSPAVKMQPF